MRLAIATGTGPAEWGLEPDWETMLTFELELAQAGARGVRRAQVIGRG